MRHGGEMGSRTHRFGVFGGFAGDGAHGVDEGVEGFARFGFGRLDHQRLMEEEREVDGGGVVAHIEQTLGMKMDTIIKASKELPNAIKH